MQKKNFLLQYKWRLIVLSVFELCVTHLFASLFLHVIRKLLMLSHEYNTDTIGGSIL